MKFDILEVMGALAPGGSAALVEAMPVDPGLFYDPDVDLSAEQGGAAFYRRLTEASADLHPLVHERMQEIAAWLYDKNALAKRGIEIIRDHVLSGEFRVVASNDAVQSEVDRFWKDPQNDMRDRLRDMTAEIEVFGEQLVSVFIHVTSGDAQFVHVDPRAVKSIIRVPGRPDQVYAISVAGETEGGMTRWIRVIQPGPDGRMIFGQPDDLVKHGPGRGQPFWQPEGLDPETRLAGVLYWRINKTRGAARGRSSLLPVIDFVDLYDKLVFDEGERVGFMRSYIWDVLVKNADEPTLRAKAAAEPPPRPGSVRYHNENETWTAVGPDLKAQDGTVVADLVLSLIATGLGVSKTWLNGAMDVNRATSMSMDGPTERRLKARQVQVGRMVEDMVRVRLDALVDAGSLSPQIDLELAVHTPEMFSKDLQRGAGALFQSTQALGMAKAAGWVDDETALEAVSVMLGEIGVNVSITDLKGRLDQARKAKAEAAGDEGGNDEMGRLPAYLGVGAGFGSDALSKELNGGVQGGRTANPGAVTGPKDLAQVVGQLTTALVALGQNSIIDTQVAQEIMVGLLEPFGVQIDLRAMQDRLARDEQEAQAQQEEMMAQAQEQPPTPGA